MKPERVLDDHGNQTWILVEEDDLVEASAEPKSPLQEAENHLKYLHAVDAPEAEIQDAELAVEGERAGELRPVPKPPNGKAGLDPSIIRSLEARLVQGSRKFVGDLNRGRPPPTDSPLEETSRGLGKG